MKYKVGDTVIIKPKEFFLNHQLYDELSEEIPDSLWPGFVSAMFKYCGKETQIIDICGGQYHLSDGGSWQWADWMLDDIRLKKLEKMLK